MNDSAKIYLFPVTENTNKLEYLSKFLAEYTAMIKRLFVAHNINVTKRNIKPTGSNKENNNYRQYIKVASPTIPANDVFALVTSEEAIKSFIEYNTSSITGSSSRSRVHLIEARLEAIYWIGFPT